MKNESGTKGRISRIRQLMLDPPSSVHCLLALVAVLFVTEMAEVFYFPLLQPLPKWAIVAVHAVLTVVFIHYVRVYVNYRSSNEKLLEMNDQLQKQITEIRRAEERLLRCEYIISTTSDLMSMVDRKYTYQAVNDAYIRAHGRERSDIVGHTVAELLSGEVFQDLAKERLDRCFKGETVKYLAWFDFSGTGRKYMDVTYYPFRPDGYTTEVVVVARDITEQKRADDALRESEEQFRGIFNSSHDGILVADVETRKFYLGNGRICKMLGYDYAELMDLGIEDLHPKEDIPFVTEQFRRMVNGDISLVKEIRCKRKDGSLFFADIGASNVQIKDRKYVMAMFRDVTESKRAEEALRDSEERLIAFGNALPDIAFILDEHGRYVDILAQPKKTSLLYADMDALKGQLLHDVLPRKNADLFLSVVKRTIETQENQSLEYVLDVQAGERWFEGRTAPLLISGKGSMVVWVSRDITARKQMEEQLEKYNHELEVRVRERTEELEEKTIQAEAANRAKIDFLSNMSHELRTPLNSIIGFTDLLTSGVAGALTDEQSDYLKSVWESGKHLNRIIDDILAMTEIELYSVAFEPSEFLLKESVEKVLGRFSGKADRQGITLSADIPDDLGRITADEQKVRQVIQHLLGNAIKFTPKGGSVRVCARRVASSKGQAAGEEHNNSLALAGDFIEISVSDTGIGIAKEDLGRLFQPFRQLSPALIKKYEGVGLGLSICKKYIELHGGRIWVESEAGKGSSFIFILPVPQ